MKKLICLSALLLGSYVYAERLDDIGPGIGNGSAVVTISKPGGYQQNCLTDITVISSNIYTFRILDNAATSYQLTMPAGSIINDDFMVEPFCTMYNSTMTIQISTTVGSTGFINYKGYIRGNK